MTRQTALAKLLKSEGDNYSLAQIMNIKRALNWYDDEIDDINWRDHIFDIVELYNQI